MNEKMIDVSAKIMKICIESGLKPMETVEVLATLQLSLIKSSQ